MIQALRIGRKVDINYPSTSGVPITVTVLSEKVTIEPTPLIIDGYGELTPSEGGFDRIVRFYTDLGWRTVALRHISIR